MTRRSQRTTDKQGSKKEALRRADRKIALRGRAYVSMLRRKRMSRATNTASFVDNAFGEDLYFKRVQSLASGVLSAFSHARVLSRHVERG